LTNNVRLGHMVLCPAFRSPTLTAKMIATLDDLSGGRLNVRGQSLQLQKGI
jgi:alkanesulfonate monooxygenase SsuD/methylene tetrahydromethanopterin reductase-like flavin-dependent oxidoreductase (luciferase family)